MLNNTHPQDYQQIELLVSQSDAPEGQYLAPQEDRDDIAREAGQVMLETWRKHTYHAQALLAAQQQAAESETALRKALLEEVTNLRETIYTLFSDDHVLLVSLGLRPSQKTDLRVKRISYDLTAAETIVRWRLLFNNALQLSVTNKNLLQKAGWTDERLTNAAALVETYTEVNNIQQVKIHAYRAEQAAAHAIEALLQRWRDQRLRLANQVVDCPPPTYPEKIQSPTAL